MVSVLSRLNDSVDFFCKSHDKSAWLIRPWSAFCKAASYDSIWEVKHTPRLRKSYRVRVKNWLWHSTAHNCNIPDVFWSHALLRSSDKEKIHKNYTASYLPNSVSTNFLLVKHWYLHPGDICIGFALLHLLVPYWWWWLLSRWWVKWKWWWLTIQ